MSGETTLETAGPWRRSWPLDGRQGTCDGCAESKPLVMAYDVDDSNEPWLCADCADDQPMRLNLCEASRLFLHPNTLYWFDVDPDCDLCNEAASLARSCCSREGAETR